MPGFFQGANVNASNGNFSNVTGMQLNIHGNVIGVEVENAYLEKLPRAKNAGYKSSNHKTCLLGTREAILQEINTWEADGTNKSVYWLKGTTGCGKSTIARTFAKLSAEEGHLGASFFCSRDFPDRSNLRLVFPTLAYHLAYKYPAFKTNLVKIILSSPDVGGESLAEQFEMFLVKPLKETGISTTIVVDALDECEDKEPVSEFLSALASYVDEIPTIKFFITGRPEDHIRSGFSIPSLRTKELSLHDVDSTSADIKTYVTARLKEIATRRKLSINGPWPSDIDIAAILRKCSGLFVIASVILDFIDYLYEMPQDRLRLIIDMPDSTIYEGKSGIDITYNQILVANFKAVHEDDFNFFDQLRLVVGSIVLAFNPLSRASLANILEMSPERIWMILCSLHSVLIIPESDLEEIRICHKSFADFITDPHRCPDARYRITASAQHLDLGVRCLKLMKTSLKKNICHLPRYVMNNDVKDLFVRREKFIGAALGYACRSWAKHLRSSSEVGDYIDITVNTVNSFFAHQFLSWLEVLSIECNFRLTIYSLHDVRSWLCNVKASVPIMLNLVDDCERFVLQFFDVMEQSATHIYHSALPWCPTSSHIRMLYQTQLRTEAKLLNAVDITWGACIRTITVNMEAETIVFSHKGALIAVGGWGFANVFDVISGENLATFHANGTSPLTDLKPIALQTIAFSPDDGLLAYIRDGRIRVSHLQTGDPVCIHEDEDDDKDEVASIIFSPCGNLVASGTIKGSIQIRDLASELGDRKITLRGHFGVIIALSWSETKNQIISGSDDMTIRVWNVATKTCSMVFHLDVGHVTALTFLQDSSLYASGSQDGTVKIYNSQSDNVIQTISAGHPIDSVQFSDDGHRIMYTSGNSGYIWDSTRQTHISETTCDGEPVAFSSNGAYIASGFGRFVKIWKTGDGCSSDKVSASRSDEVEQIAFSPDAELLAFRSHARVNILGTTIGACLYTFYRHGVCVSSVAFSPNSRFVGCLSSQYFMGVKRGRVWIWSAETGNQTDSVEVDLDVHHIALSSDCRRLATVSHSCIKLWNLASRSCLANLDFDSPLQKEAHISFSDDGTRVFMESDGVIDGWHIFPTIVFYRGTSSNDNPFTSLPMVFAPMQERPRRDAPTQSPHCKRLDGHDEWIQDRYGRRILWVPPDWRDASSDVQGMKIAVRTTSGKACMADFSDVPLEKTEL